MLLLPLLLLLSRASWDFGNGLDSSSPQPGRPGPSDVTPRPLVRTVIHVVPRGCLLTLRLASQRSRGFHRATGALVHV